MPEPDILQKVPILLELEEVTDENARFPGVVSETDILLFLAGKPRNTGG
jgi:hypothetical protein